MRAGKDFGPRPEDTRSDEQVVRDRITRHQKVLASLEVSGVETPFAKMRRAIALGAIKNNLQMLNQVDSNNKKAE
jgi:hypothetical protein